MFNVAVVGVNRIGHTHCQYYIQNPDTDLKAVCDLLKDRTEKAGIQYDAASYTNINELLEKEDIDIVSIATSGVENGSHHFEPAMAAIRAEKDVIVEKPISNNIEEARQMVQTASDYNVRLACNLNHSFVPAARKGKELIDQGKLGSLLFINMKLAIQNPKDASPWFHMRALHPHSMDVMRYFAGAVESVQSFMLRAPGRSSWSTVSINLKFTSGTVGHLSGSYDMSRRHPIEYCEAAGDKGRFVIDNVYERISYFPHDKDEQTSVQNPIINGVSGFQDTFRYRLDKFIGQIKAGVSPNHMEASGADALAGQEVIEAAIRSHIENGKVIKIPEVVM